MNANLQTDERLKSQHQVFQQHRARKGKTRENKYDAARRKQRINANLTPTAKKDFGFRQRAKSKKPKASYCFFATMASSSLFRVSRASPALEASGARAR